MPKQSAGILLYRESSGTPQVLLGHPGGPLWAKKDEGAWSIPKGEFTDGEDPLAAARREFEEETGFPVTGDPLPLAPLRQPTGKVVHAWAVKGDLDPGAARSNTFSMEWPPRSGRQREFPEIDRVCWFGVEEARRKILKGQAGFVSELANLLGRSR